MFEENENLVEETENVEELTTEEEVQEEEQPQQEETFTKKQVDEMIAKKLSRKEAKLRKEYDRKYGRLENVVNAGLGTNDTEEAIEQLTKFYTDKGINIPQENYSNKDLEVLAEAEANDIISDGYDEIVAEVDRLAAEGDKMSQREKLVFTKLANERKRIEESKELASIGVTELDPEFKEFESKLNPSLSLKEKYEMYLSTKQRKENNIIGSLKDGATSQKKEYYTDKEINKLSLDDLDNDEVWDAVRKSMTSR